MDGLTSDFTWMDVPASDHPGKGLRTFVVRVGYHRDRWHGIVIRGQLRTRRSYDDTISGQVACEGQRVAIRKRPRFDQCKCIFGHVCLASTHTLYKSLPHAVCTCSFGGSLASDHDPFPSSSSRKKKAIQGNEKPNTLPFMVMEEEELDKSAKCSVFSSSEPFHAETMNRKEEERKVDARLVNAEVGEKEGSSWDIPAGTIHVRRGRKHLEQRLYNIFVDTVPNVSEMMTQKGEVRQDGPFISSTYYGPPESVGSVPRAAERSANKK
ncbi:hypothetical protein ACRALDRAFT_208205 [Sodiomyces alcalophilus JCM 7366]|uniref:uncharacterized protein n=1 Tax=Sodiomyces alcalophilus JCM 7366 TaxID=591952 RepID=UPI0039B422D3